jgi:hypothetical protein
MRKCSAGPLLCLEPQVVRDIVKEDERVWVDTNNGSQVPGIQPSKDQKRSVGVGMSQGASEA